MAAQVARVVVKLGGSLAGDPALAHWLRELEHNRTARFVAVPGGGPFADAVRAAQGLWQFGDEVAHLMAIGAMDQFGHMLCGIATGSIPCSTLPQIEQAWAGGRLPVWLPSQLISADRQLPRSWNVTSDTIAAWLAGALGAAGLLLVKSCELPDGPDDPALLAAAGIVDPGLPDFLSCSGVGLRLLQRDRWSDLSDAVSDLMSRN